MSDQRMHDRTAEERLTTALHEASQLYQDAKRALTLAVARYHVEDARIEGERSQLKKRYHDDVTELDMQSIANQSQRAQAREQRAIAEQELDNAQRALKNWQLGIVDPKKETG